MTINDILNYINHTPQNTNRAVLKPMLESLGNEGTKDYNELTNKPLIYNELYQSYSTDDTQKGIMVGTLDDERVGIALYPTGIMQDIRGGNGWFIRCGPEAKYFNASLGPLSIYRSEDGTSNISVNGKYTPQSGVSIVTKQYVDDAIGNISSLEYQVVQELPAVGTKGIVYLVNNDTGTHDAYDEYIWITDRYEKIGTTDVNLNEYLQKSGGTMTGALTIGEDIDNYTTVDLSKITVNAGADGATTISGGELMVSDKATIGYIKFHVQSMGPGEPDYTIGADDSDITINATTVNFQHYNATTDTRDPIRLGGVATPTNDNDAVNKAYVDLHNPEIQRQGNWSYKVFPDGTFEAWYKANGQSLTITELSGSLYRSQLETLTLPSNLTNGHTCEIIDCYVNCGHNNYPCWGVIASIQPPGSENSIRWYAVSGGSRSNSPNYYITCFVMGNIS